MLCVPDAGSCHGLPDAVLHIDVLRVPERVFPLELGAVELDIAAFLEGRLAVVENCVVDFEVRSAVEGALAAEALLVNLLVLS